MTFDGDPDKFAETLHRLVVSVGDDKKIPLILPMGDDSLELVKGKAKKLHEVVASTASWSKDLKKDKAKM